MKVFQIFPRKFRVYLFEHTRGIYGLKGQVLRLALVKTLALNCGENIGIQENVYMFHLEGIVFGNNISIDSMSHIDGAGGLEIGDHVMVAHGVTVRSTGHKYREPSVPIDAQGYFFEKTVICDNVWIGAKATILSGIRLGTGSIVGANAVVTKDVPPNMIVGGSPARVLKSRI